MALKITILLIFVINFASIACHLYRRQEHANIASILSTACERQYQNEESAVSSAGACVLTCIMTEEKCNAIYLQENQCFHLLPCDNGDSIRAQSTDMDIYAPGECRMDFTKIGQKCYGFFSSNISTKTYAEEFCKKKGATLARPTVNGETEILSEMKDRFQNENFLTSLIVNASGHVMTSDRQLVDSNWFGNEPNCIMYASRQFSDFGYTWGSCHGAKALCKGIIENGVCPTNLANGTEIYFSKLNCYIATNYTANSITDADDYCKRNLNFSHNAEVGEVQFERFNTSDFMDDKRGEDVVYWTSSVLSSRLMREKYSATGETVSTQLQPERWFPGDLEKEKCVALRYVSDELQGYVVKDCLESSSVLCEMEPYE